MGYWTVSVVRESCGYDGHVIVPGRPVYVALGRCRRCRDHAELFGVEFNEAQFNAAVADLQAHPERQVPDKTPAQTARESRGLHALDLSTVDAKSAAANDRD